MGDADVCLSRITKVAKESENIRPEDAELERKWMKHTNVQIYCVWCLSTTVNVSRGITLSTSTNTFGKYYCKFLDF
jgi:predicted branched-subunit amino acid permease